MPHDDLQTLIILRNRSFVHVWLSILVLCCPNEWRLLKTVSEKTSIKGLATLRHVRFSRLPFACFCLVLFVEVYRIGKVAARYQWWKVSRFVLQSVCYMNFHPVKPLNFLHECRFYVGQIFHVPSNPENENSTPSSLKTMVVSPKSLTNSGFPFRSLIMLNHSDVWDVFFGCIGSQNQLRRSVCFLKLPRNITGVSESYILTSEAAVFNVWGMNL